MLGVDTEVAIDGRVYGKPADEQGARAMLAGARRARAPGRLGPHAARRRARTDRSVGDHVRFRQLDPDEVDAYVAAGEWQGRAGGYAIQGRGAALVERIEGDYANVVGLPVALLVQLPARARA